MYSLYSIVSKLEDPDDHGMGIDTLAGLGSPDFSTKAHGVQDSEEARDRRWCRSTRRRSRTQNELAKAKESHSFRHFFDIDVCKRKGLLVSKTICLLAFDVRTGETLLDDVVSG